MLSFSFERQDTRSLTLSSSQFPFFFVIRNNQAATIGKGYGYETHFLDCRYTHYILHSTYSNIIHISFFSLLDSRLFVCVTELQVPMFCCSYVLRNNGNELFFFLLFRSEMKTKRHIPFPLEKRRRHKIPSRENSFRLDFFSSFSCDSPSSSS